MKNLLVLLVSFMILTSGFAQVNCLDFENETPNTSAGHTNPAGNWTNLFCDFDYKQEASGNIYLEADDNSGASWMLNNVDFTGDLSQSNNCQTFCYDVNYLSAGSNLGFFTNSIYIYSGGTTPQNSTLCARFVLNNAVNAGSGWNTFCLPLDLCSGIALPNNSQGYWQWYTSINSNNIGTDCNDWNTLIQNVTGFGFFVDRGSQQTELWGYDNFCLLDTICYNNKTFSTCFHTDFENPMLNDYNEYGYAGVQTVDGNYFVLGKTQNRNVFGEPTTSDYTLHTSLDAIGNVDAPSAYVYSEEPVNLIYEDQLLVEMNPPFNSQPEPYVLFTNYREGGSTNSDIQITFLDEQDCVTSVIDWPDSPGFSEKVKDAIQADNGDLIILGEFNDNMTPGQTYPFLYGFTIPGANFGNQFLNFIGPSGVPTFDVDANAICEYKTPAGADRFLITGEVDNNLMVLDFDNLLNVGGNYLWYNIDNDSNTQDVGIDVVHDKINGGFLVAGILRPAITGLDPQRIFLTRLDAFGQVVWTKVFDIPGGDETVEEIHLNEKGEIAITGRCNITYQINTPRSDRSYLLKTDTNGSLIFTNKYTNAEGNEVQDLQYTIDGGYLLIGSCWTNSFEGEPFPGYVQNHDIWTVKTDSLGRISGTDQECVEPVDVAVFEPEHEMGLNEVFPEDFSLDGANYDYQCSAFVTEMEICDQYCPPPPVDSLCDITSVIDNISNDSCCIVQLDLINNMPNAYKIQVDIINPSTAFFDWTNVTTGLTTTILSSNSIQIKRPTNAPLPIGTVDKYLTFCMADSFNISNLQDIKITYLDSLCTPIVDCMDTLQIECPITPIEQDCYEVLIDTVYCDTIPGLYNLCFRVKNNDVTNNLKWIDLFSTGVSFVPANPICLSPSVPPNTTSTQICTQLFDFSGLPLPRTIKIDHAGHDSLYQYCCSDLDTLCVVLPSCCDPCVPDWVMLSPDSLSNDSCCYALDIDVTCPLSLTKIVTESITPGVKFGTLAVGGSCSSNWNIGAINPASTRATFVPVGGVAPIGFCDDLINFCLDDTLGNPVQQVAVHYIMNNSFGQDSVACSDTLFFECSIDQECLEIVSDSVYCDANGDYFLDFCVKNISSPAFNADQLIINVKPPNPSLLYITPNNLMPIPLNHGSTYCGTVQIGGITPISPLAGQTLKLGFVMHENNVLGQDTCCVDEEMLCVTLPPCDDCCDDFDGFCNSIQYYSNIYGVCDTGHVQISFADSCTYTDITWGDGSSESHVGTFSTNHYYNTPGSYVVCADFKESSDGGASFCWNKLICDTIDIAMCPMDSIPCELIDFDTMAYLGWAAATCMSGSNASSYVCGIIDVRNHQGAPINNNWGPPYYAPAPGGAAPAPTMYHGTGANVWDRGNLGEVFGLAVDPYGMVYTASFSMYDFESYGVAGVPSIYKLNPYTSAITNLNASLPQSTDPARNNQSPAFGNICYNFQNHLLYVSNLEDGIIYALDANTGAVVDQFDHALPDNGAVGFAPRGERIFGVGYNHVENRIYYSVWNLDELTGPVAGVYNEIWSIGLDQNGDFTSPNIGVYEFNVPYTLYHNFSNPVADISFDATGAKMLLSERTMYYNIWDPVKLGSLAHHSRTVEYTSSSGTGNFSTTYVAEPVSKYDGFNAVGGNDYAYGDSTLLECDSFVLMTEDALRLNVSSGNDGIYGIRGIANSGGSVPMSWMLDLDMDLIGQDKRDVGDVEVFRNLCCGYTPPPLITCDSLDWSGFDVILDTTNCMPGMFPDVIITPVFGTTIPDWIDYDFGCDNTVDYTESGPPYNPVLWSGITNANLLLCVNAYEIVNGDTCDVEIIRDLSLELCPALDSCCQSFDLFQMALDSMQIYSIADSGFVENMYLDDCHDVEINWGDGTTEGFFSGSQLPKSHEYASNGVYQICVTVFELDENGGICFEDSRCETVDIIIDGLNDFEIDPAYIDFYPNPTDSKLKINAKGNIVLEQIVIYDVHGREVGRQVANASFATIEMSHFSDGVYFIIVKDDQGRFARSRIVKQRK